MEELVLQSERLAMQIDRDLEMPRIKRNLSQILNAGNQLWNRTVRTSANRDASEVRASVLLGARGYDYQKVSRNLDNLVTRAVKQSLTNRPTQPVLRGTDIKNFVKYERENSIMKIIEETKTIIKDQIEKLYWDVVHGGWKKDKLELLDSISSLDTETNTRVRSDGDPSDTSNQDVASKAAQDCEEKGQFLEAVKLYDSVSNYEKVMQLLIMLLSDVLTGVNTDPDRSKLEDLALKVANRYCTSQVNVPNEVAGTYYLLIDLMTFFNYYHSKHYNEALDTIYKLKILPSSQSEVEAKSRSFKRYAEEIRRNISDILMATMQILYATYKEQPSKDIQDKAKALIIFSGLIEYRLPSETIAKIIELEVLIN